MDVRIYIFILLVALSSSCLSLPSQAVSWGVEAKTPPSDRLPAPSSLHTRQARAVAAPPAGQLASYNHAQEEEDPHTSLSQLLARLLSRKGYQTRSSLTSRASGLGPAHRIKDRDYLGWMDFGRRSAEEYEYSA